MANKQELAKLTDDLKQLENEQKQLLDDETGLRYEIKELIESIAELDKQLGSIESSKAKIEKLRAKNNKPGYTGAETNDSKRITTKIKDISNLKKLIEIQKKKLGKKQKDLKAVVLSNNTKLAEIAELSKDHEIELDKHGKESKINRELAISAGVPKICLDSIEVKKFDDKKVEIRFCGVGSKTGIRSKIRIIMPNGEVYRKDKEDGELFLVPRECL